VLDEVSSISLNALSRFPGLLRPEASPALGFASSLSEAFDPSVNQLAGLFKASLIPGLELSVPKLVVGDEEFLGRDEERRKVAA
jgi:hypothetical protein